MLSLYEILKASKTGIAPDMWTALAGKNWGGADSGHEVKELTGIPPLSFRADGTPLLDYLISGNTVQNGTPTPSNPVDVNGVGERTENLFDNANLITDAFFKDDIIAHAIDVSPRNIIYVPVQGGKTYTFSINNFVSNTNFQSVCSIDKPAINTIYRINDQTTFVTHGGVTTFTRTIPNEANWWAIQIMSLDNLDNEIMINEGSTPLPYEPWGYKIPISSGGVTTNIYLGSTQTTRRIKKLVLDGTENWSESACAIGYRFVIPITSAMRSDKTFGVRSMCTHQILVRVGDTFNVLGAYTITDTSVLLMTLNGDTRLASWKSWLAAQYAAGTPVTIWYILVTPETAAVNEPLMKIGDYADTVSYEQAGVQIPTNRGNTVIDVETTLKPSQMYIKYQE